MDDRLAMLIYEHEDLKFFNYPSLSFMMEKEINGFLLFLDVLEERSSNEFSKNLLILYIPWYIVLL